MAEDTSRWSKANAPWQKSSGGGATSGGGKGGDGGWENDTKMQHAAAAAIRDALTENARGGRDDDVDAGIVSVGEASIRHTEVSDVGGGGSRLGKRDLGSSAMQAALTLHPCVHVGGVNDAAKSTLHTMFAMAGPCSVSLVVDDDGEPTGEASVTYESAAAAAAAIQMYDGSPFDDGVLVVSASKNAAQGSLTKRGRGRHNMTLHEKTQIRASAALQERAKAEKDAFAAARESAKAAAKAPPPAAAAARAAPFGGAGGEKRKAAAAKALPSFLNVPNKKPAPAAAAPAASVLGLGGYESSDDDDDDEPAPAPAPRSAASAASAAAPPPPISNSFVASAAKAPAPAAADEPPGALQGPTGPPAAVDEEIDLGDD